MPFGLVLNYHTLRETNSKSTLYDIGKKSEKNPGLTQILTLTSAMPVDDGYGCL